MTQKVKKLTRSKKNRIIAGICGGLGEYFNIDPNLFRIGFVILGLSGAFGVVLYIVMLFIIPEEK